MRALVLGCGPAGLIATHALSVEGGWKWDILSKRPVKSPMLGAQYLHGPIPGITSNIPEAYIETYKMGSYEDYRYKVYGMMPGFDKIKASGINQPALMPAWDIRSVYDDLWEEYHEGIRGEDVDSELLAELAPKYDLIVSAIPAPALCRVGHDFRTIPVYVVPGVSFGLDGADNVVIANGQPSPGWYRSSKIFGVEQVEYPGRTKPPLEGVVGIQKVVDTNCDCWPNIVKAGRMATWTKGTLAHHAFDATLQAARAL